MILRIGFRTSYKNIAIEQLCGPVMDTRDEDRFQKNNEG